MTAPATRRVTSWSRRLLSLPARELRLLFSCWLGLLLADLRLRSAPRAALEAMLAPTPGPRGESGLHEAAAVARQIDRAAAHHLWPMACLPRALALCRMLRRRGFAARIRIGVRAYGSPLPAHAWVEVDGEPIGQPEGSEESLLALVGSDPRLPGDGWRDAGVDDPTERPGG